MNSSSLRRDVSDYAAVIWQGRTFILVMTLAAVILMVVLTAALPRLYILRSEVSTGAVVNVQPRETNLFVEAVDRSEWMPPGGEFAESITDRLTASFRPPHALVMEARVTDPADGLRRLTVLTDAVFAELNTRFDAAVAERERFLSLAQSAQLAANDGARQLARVFDERHASALAAAAAAQEAATASAARRAALQRAWEARLSQPMLFARDRLLREDAPPAFAAAIAGALERLAPEDNPRKPASLFEAIERADARQRLLSTLGNITESALMALPPLFRRIAADDLDIARAMEAHRAAEHLIRRDERARELLAGAGAIVDPGQAEAFERSLTDLEKLYRQTGDPFAARAVRETASVVHVTANALRKAQAERDAPLLKLRPEIIVPPTLPDRPAWPRPMVNLPIALIFGFVASVVIVVFRESRPERQVPS